MGSTFKVEIVKIDSIQNHPNADRLEICQIKGWSTVVPKGEYKENDLVVYLPIDSILPIEVESKLFGADSKVKLNHSRVKTIKLRGAISQGMVCKPEVLGLTGNEEGYKFKRAYPEGHDFSKQLGITKYEPPAEKQAALAGNGRKPSKKEVNTNFFKYTGIENFKNYNKLFEEGEEVVVTEKIHGTNFRAGWVKTEANTLLKRVKRLLGMLPEYEFVYGSHHVQLQSKWLYKGFYETNVYAEAVVKYNLRELIPKGHVIYGEIYGDGIQKGYTYGCQKGERKLVVFDVMKDGQYLNWSLAEQFLCASPNSLKLTTPPILYIGPYNQELIKSFVSGDSILAPNQKVREGVVIKPVEETKCFMGRKILKLISDQYLLKDQDDLH